MKMTEEKLMKRTARIAAVAALAAGLVAGPTVAAEATGGACSYTLAADHLSFLVRGDRGEQMGATWEDPGHFVATGFELSRATGRATVYDPYQSYINAATLQVQTSAGRVCHSVPLN